MKEETKSFIYKDKTYSLKVVDEFVSPNNDKQALEAWWKYKAEKEDEAFRNAPPELFKFYQISIEESLETELVGANSPEEAIQKASRYYTPIRVANQYEKYCNFAALSDEEASAQAYDL